MFNHIIMITSNIIIIIIITIIIVLKKLDIKICECYIACLHTQVPLSGHRSPASNESNVKYVTKIILIRCYVPLSNYDNQSCVCKFNK